MTLELVTVGRAGAGLADTGLLVMCSRRAWQDRRGLRAGLWPGACMAHACGRELGTGWRNKLAGLVRWACAGMVRWAYAGMVRWLVLAWCAGSMLAWCVD